MPFSFSDVNSKNHVFAGDQFAVLPDVAADGPPGMRHIHILVLGTGFAGLGMAIHLKQRGYEDFAVIERAAEVGGNWRDNTYPGCASNVPSHLYSFSFAPNPHWSEVYPAQPEIHGYLRACAERFGIRAHIRWNTELLHALWQEEGQVWLVTTTRGSFTTDILISGNGQLNEPSLPEIAGIERFEGTLFHSARWNHAYDLSGKHVAVIGNGASAIQFVPQIQPLVSHLALFQRTPAWILPLGNHPLSARKRALFRRIPLTQRLVRAKMYWQNEATTLRLIQHPRILAPGDKLMKLGLRMARRHLARQIADPVLRAKLSPPGNAGQILRADTFYPAVSQPNVEVITEPIREIGTRGLVTGDGQEHEVDAIICATGFRVTNAQFPDRLRGRNGLTLAAGWQAGAYAYLGTTVAGFPNLFLLCGPGTSLPHNSMVCMVEAQITYILDCLRVMERRGIQAVEVRAAVQDAFNREMTTRAKAISRELEQASSTLKSGNHHVPIWPGSTIEFWFRTRRFDPKHYDLSPRISNPCRGCPASSVSVSAESERSQ